MAFRTIHTLDARDNFLLEFFKDRYDLGDFEMYYTIWGLADEFTEMLEGKGVYYSKLKSALVPQTKKSEVALFFDRVSIESGWYAWQVHARVIPLLNRHSSHSILHGDLLAQPDWLRTAFESHLEHSGSPFSIVGRNQIYCVYLNNVSMKLRRTLHETLKEYRPYIGYADTTYASPFKAHLSLTLVSAYLKYGHIVLQSRPDNDPPPADENMVGYPFEDNGLICQSVPTSYYGLFLSYKIERPILTEYKADTLFSTNVLSDTPADPASYTLEIEKGKFEYLRREKMGSLRRLGVLDTPKTTLEQLIQAKLRSNYIYNMSYDDESGVRKFNIVLELASLDGGEPLRTLAAFEYIATARRIRLITLY